MRSNIRVRGQDLVMVITQITRCQQVPLVFVKLPICAWDTGEYLNDGDRLETPGSGQTLGSTHVLLALPTEAWL